MECLANNQGYSHTNTHCIHFIAIIQSDAISYKSIISKQVGPGAQGFGTIRTIASAALNRGLDEQQIAQPLRCSQLGIPKT